MSTTPVHQAAALVVASLLSTAASAQDDWLGERDRIFVAFERQPLADVARAYLHCARESEQRVLGFGEAAVCSIASEVLLKRRFDGDFSALLAWWKVQRTEPGQAGSR